MKTFGYGKYSVRASSIEEGLAIVHELERLEKERTTDYLSTHHINQRDRRCYNCGRYVKEIVFERITCLGRKV